MSSGKPTTNIVVIEFSSEGCWNVLVVVVVVAVMEGLGCNREAADPDEDDDMGDNVL